MDPEIIAALIGPLITAGLAASAVGFREWRHRRATRDRRQESLEQATNEVAFLDAWISTHAKVATAEQHQERAARALADLERSYDMMTAVHRATVDAPRPRTTTDRLGALLLLRLGRTGAKVWRACYYVFLVLGVLFIAAGTSSIVKSASDGIAVTILAGMFFTLLSFAPATLCYFLARLANRPKRDRRRAVPGAPPMDPALAGYPPPGYDYYAPGPNQPYGPYP